MTAVRVSLAAARLSGAAVLVLGLLFWSGHAQGLVPLHMALGGILVLALWTLAGLAFRANVDRTAVATAIVWGLVVPLLGAVQLELPTGGGYSIIRVVHLLVGLGALVQAEGLARRIKN